MTKQVTVFDETWLKQAFSNSDEKSWASDVLESLSTTGGIYLCTLRNWFEAFPLEPKDKIHLRARLQSSRDDEHLGAVNELAWYAFTQRHEIKSTPLPTSKTSRPDFHLKPPVDCYVEVSTLNVSEKDSIAREAEEPVALNHNETIRRVVGKLTDEKLKQLKFAQEESKPSVLVLFDYTEWSGFGTSFFKALGDHLVGPHLGFKCLPPTLSAIVYLERRVCDGRIRLSSNRSAVYYNPLALHPLPLGTFAAFNQFSMQPVFVERQALDSWVYL